jgi:hypothetical protein
VALNDRCHKHGTRLDGPEGTDGCSHCRRAAKVEAERLADESNPFALHNREVKVGKLLDEIDRQCGFAGLDPQADGFAIADMGARWTEQQWGQIAINAATKPPSDKTKGIVLERYRQRGRKAQERAAS